MAERPTVAEMRERLAECARHGGGVIPRDAALVWDGYFAALIEWGLISLTKHAELLALLPELPDSPVLGVFLGVGGGPAALAYYVAQAPREYDLLCVLEQLDGVARRIVE